VKLCFTGGLLTLSMGGSSYCLGGSLCGGMIGVANFFILRIIYLERIVRLGQSHL